MQSNGGVGSEGVEEIISNQMTDTQPPSQTIRDFEIRAYEAQGPGPQTAGHSARTHLYAQKFENTQIDEKIV